MRFCNISDCSGTPNSARAFSLIEVVLALGVISFAIIGIMGLFPVAMKAGLESQRETRAAHIARAIFTDLKASPATNALILVGPNFSDVKNLALTNTGAWPVSVYYDESGIPVTNSSSSAAFEAVITSRPNTPSAGLAQIQVDVSAPVQAQATNRSTYTFVTLMWQ